MVIQCSKICSHCHSSLQFCIRSTWFYSLIPYLVSQQITSFASYMASILSMMIHICITVVTHFDSRDLVCKLRIDGIEGKWCLPPTTFTQNLDVKGRRHISCEETGTILTWDILSTVKKLQCGTNVQLSLLSDLYDQMLKHYFCAVVFCGVNVSWSGAPMKPFYRKNDTVIFHFGTSTSTKLAVYVATIFIMEFGKPLLAKYSQVMPQTCAHWQLFPQTVLTVKVHILDQQVHLSVEGISEEPSHNIMELNFWQSKQWWPTERQKCS